MHTYKVTIATTHVSGRFTITIKATELTEDKFSFIFIDAEGKVAIVPKERILCIERGDENSN